MSWYTKSGEKDFDKFKQDDPNQKNLFRFWLKVGEKKEIVFLADERFSVWEHTVPMGNNKYETFTCSRDENCKFCGEKGRATFTEYCSILDMTPYTAKDGTARKYSKKAIAFRGNAIEVMDRRRKENGDNLTAFKVTCFRDGEKTPSCGNDFTVGQKVDLTKLPADVAKPYDFADYLAPLPLATIEARMKFGGGNVATRPRATASSDPFAESPANSMPGTVEDLSDLPF